MVHPFFMGVPVAFRAWGLPLLNLMTKEEIRKFRVFCITTSNRYGCSCKLANTLDTAVEDNLDDKTLSLSEAKKRCTRKSLSHVQNIMNIEACVWSEIIKSIYGAIENMSLRDIKEYFRNNG